MLPGDLVSRGLFHGLQLWQPLDTTTDMRPYQAYQQIVGQRGALVSGQLEGEVESLFEGC